MRYRFEFPKIKIEIDSEQILSHGIASKNTVYDVMRGAGNGWLMYKNSLGEIMSINLKRCIRIVEKKS